MAGRSGTLLSRTFSSSSSLFSRSFFTRSFTKPSPFPCAAAATDYSLRHQHSRYLCRLRSHHTTPSVSLRFQGNKLLVHRELKFQKNFLGNRLPVGCMTTSTHPESSLVEGSGIPSAEIDQPQRIKFKRLDKTAKHIMNILDKEAVDKVRSDREIPDIQPGYIIQLKVEVPENKRRVSTLKGIVIAKRNAGLNSTFRLRRLVAGVGVESVFPLYSPNIKEINVLDKKKVRRAKLYYLRDRMNALKNK